MLRFLAGAAVACVAIVSACTTSGGGSLESRLHGQCTASGMSDAECACVTRDLQASLSDADFTLLAQGMLDEQFADTHELDAATSARFATAMAHAEETCGAAD